MPTTEWDFAVLGPVRAWRDGEEADLGSPQQRSTLTALLLHEGGQVGIDELIAGMWGEHPPRAAANTIRTYVSRLRRVLDDGSRASVIVPVAGGYRFSFPGVTLDLVRFRDLTAAAARASTEDASALLRRALGLWHGSPLAGLPGPYVASQRRRLTQLRAAAEEARIAADIDLGRYSDALADLTMLIAEQPLHEPLRELQMLALWRGGHQAGALRAFHATRTLLADELGIQPGAPLQRMHRHILRGDDLQAGGRPSPAPVPAWPRHEWRGSTVRREGSADVAAQYRASQLQAR